LIGRGQGVRKWECCEKDVKTEKARQRYLETREDDILDTVISNDSKTDRTITSSSHETFC
jgi:hypothetical protein